MRKLTPRERLQLQQIATDFRRLLDQLPLIIGGVFFVLGLATVGFQIYVYLRGGDWVPISLETLVRPLGGSAYELWKIEPSWVGLKRVVSGTLAFIPLSVALFVVGIGAVHLFNAIVESIRTARAGNEPVPHDPDRGG